MLPILFRPCPELLKVEDEFEKKCEMFPQHDGHFIIVWEDYPTYEGDQWDTMADDYWGNTMDVNTILDKC